LPATLAPASALIAGAPDQEAAHECNDRTGQVRQPDLVGTGDRDRCAAAAAWRLAADSNAFKFRAGVDRFELITQTRADPSAATGAIDELRRQIEAKDSALKNVTTDLTEREGQLQKLPARLRATAAGSAVSAAPAVDCSKYKTATARIDEVNSALAKIAPAEK
jgi:hypothetical protein